MTAIDAARIVTRDGCQLLRLRKDSSGEFDVKPAFTGNKRGWLYLDAFTASAIVTVHDALNETNRAKFTTMPITRMADVAFKICSTGGKRA